MCKKYIRTVYAHVQYSAKISANSKVNTHKVIGTLVAAQQTHTVYPNNVLRNIFSHLDFFYQMMIF